MRSVLDASVAFKWFVSEPHANKAVALRDDFIANLHELLAPDVFPIEIAITRSERKGIMTPAEGAQAMADLLTVLPELHPSLALFPRAYDIFPRAYDIASSARIGIYDCLYVALAEREQCELITADVKLLNNLQSQFPFIRDLATT